LAFVGRIIDVTVDELLKEELREGLQRKGEAHPKGFGEFEIALQRKARPRLAC